MMNSTQFKKEIKTETGGKIILEYHSESNQAFLMQFGEDVNDGQILVLDGEQLKQMLDFYREILEVQTPG